MHKEEDALNHTVQIKIKTIARILCLLMHLKTFHRTHRGSNEPEREEGMNKYLVIAPPFINFAKQ